MSLNYTFDATVAGASATSYVTAADADNYIAVRPEANSWASLTEAQKQAYLMQATADVDRLRFIGRKYNGLETDESASNYQRLKFPRSVQASEYIPEEVQLATCVQALYILANAGKHDETAKLAGQGAVSISISGAMQMNVRQTPHSQICPEAKRLLARWISRAIDFGRS